MSANERRKAGRREMPPVELVIAYAQECSVVIDADGWHLVPPALGAPRRVLDGDQAEGGRR